jgi:predicted cupin superfamily sugar epimerase
MNNLSFELIHSGEESYEVKTTVIYYLLESFFISKFRALVEIHVFNSH